MRRTNARFVAFALAIGAFFPTLLAAQAPPAQRPAPRPRAAAPAPGATRPATAQSGPGSRWGGPDARVGGGGHPASMLLRARTQLELTDDQVKRLEAMQAAPAPKSNRSDLMRAQADLLDATKGDGNLARARTALDRLSRLRNDQVLARLKAQQDVRAVLTSVQRTKVDNMRQRVRSRVGANRPRGMSQRGIRQGRQGQEGPQGPMPRMRRGGESTDHVSPVPPAN